MTETIVDHGEWEWSLIVEDGDVIARKPIKYDGALTYSTEDRHTPVGARSEYNLDPLAVIQHFQTASQTDYSERTLVEATLGALARDATTGDAVGEASA